MSRNNGFPTQPGGELDRLVSPDPEDGPTLKRNPVPPSRLVVLAFPEPLIWLSGSTIELPLLFDPLFSNVNACAPDAANTNAAVTTGRVAKSFFISFTF